MNRYDLFKKLVEENGSFIIDAVDRKSNPVFSLCINKVSFSDGSEAIEVKQLVFIRPYIEASEKVTPIVFTYHLKKDGDILINQKEVENKVADWLSSEDIKAAVSHVIWDLNYPWNYTYHFEETADKITLRDSSFITSGKGSNFVIRPYDEKTNLYDLWQSRLSL
ncbi:MAG: hypothetical protein UT66_C0024G0008 [candidate division CPR2 bacterium GW2011_GWC1_39_9]|uniref:Uncharacterized protein n=1 Tax=candidate division CPR2 bacterium GW2011_GWC2_39_10 TaxID=1618345 RepID=A0A0G0PWL5_UNCC2|nr:MAG: hypothetical protein UT18_C0016G0032 [candidate division CPR2 bacterium GW2011_GWC2_39_10]KKR34424.1 MAG: hypothetical protein UT66_C0024G0008 [candidate division CPR2 bacterium GW2011_GWC1_39_9]